MQILSLEDVEEFLVETFDQVEDPTNVQLAQIH